MQCRGSRRRPTSPPFAQYDDFENGWHGGPPASKLTLAPLQPSLIEDLFRESLWMSPGSASFLLRPFPAIVARRAVPKPASSSPMSKPPAPVKSDSTVCRGAAGLRSACMRISSCHVLQGPMKKCQKEVPAPRFTGNAECQGSARLSGCRVPATRSSRFLRWRFLARERLASEEAETRRRRQQRVLDREN